MRSIVYRKSVSVHETEFTVQHFLSSITTALAAVAETNNVALCRILYRVVL